MKVEREVEIRLMRAFTVNERRNSAEFRGLLD